ncbi:Protein TPR3 [Camellia lanceoleosa]|uniref:Protein TPR3 n=1 Tax=Camellia lanceoleosa TaxID=1840588 RepID=A0ACC0HI28_9ERIC|nr:Protein TPR3 [Camellia lanceoleosa]
MLKKEDCYNGRVEVPAKHRLVNSFSIKIDAHTGNVSDLAFSHPNKQLCVITCGEDKTIKVWDVATGSKQYTFEGHQLPVYSVCPHTKENIQFIFSTGIDGKIKAWLYDNLGSRADYDAPGHSCTTMAYSADGTSKVQKFRHIMRELQGAIIVGSIFHSVLGFSGFMSLFVRLINPVVVAPTVM